METKIRAKGQSEGELRVGVEVKESGIRANRENVESLHKNTEKLGEG